MRFTTHRVYLSERLQSARGLGWEFPADFSFLASPRPACWSSLPAGGPAGLHSLVGLWRGGWRSARYLLRRFVSAHG